MLYSAISGYSGLYSAISGYSGLYSAISGYTVLSGFMINALRLKLIVVR